MTFKTEIIENNENWNIGKPLCYRLKLLEYNGELILAKQYFKSGFNDSEKFDDWWICVSRDELCWCSIITKKVDDTKYLKELETKIFEIYYDASKNLEKKLKENLENYIEYINNSIIRQEEITKFVDKFNRRRKLKQLNKTT